MIVVDDFERPKDERRKQNYCLVPDRSCNGTSPSGGCYDTVINSLSNFPSYFCNDMGADTGGRLCVDYQSSSEPASRFLSLTFDIGYGVAFSGFSEVVGTPTTGWFNVRALGARYLSFRVRSSSPMMDVEVALKSADELETTDKALIAKLLPGGITEEWQTVRIDLPSLMRVNSPSHPTCVDLERLSSINFAFSQAQKAHTPMGDTPYIPSCGRIDLDDIGFGR